MQINTAWGRHTHTHIPCVDYMYVRMRIQSTHRRSVNRFRSANGATSNLWRVSSANPATSAGFCRSCVVLCLLYVSNKFICFATKRKPQNNPQTSNLEWLAAAQRSTVALLPNQSYPICLILNRTVQVIIIIIVRQPAQCGTRLLAIYFACRTGARPFCVCMLVWVCLRILVCAICWMSLGLEVVRYAYGIISPYAKRFLLAEQA